MYSLVRNSSAVLCPKLSSDWWLLASFS